MEFLIVLASILTTAFFAMAEMSTVSASKAKLQADADDGSARARAALDLANQPNRLLSTVQVGITFAGIVGAIYGGAPLGLRLEPMLRDMSNPWVVSHAHQLADGFVSFAFGTLTVVFGELVPKRVALMYPNGVAKIFAGPMFAISRLAAPVIKLMSATADIVLRLLGLRKSDGPDVSEDEVRMLIDQGMETGVFHQGERDMVEGVLSLDRLTAGSLMTPRTRMVWLNSRDSDEDNWAKVAGSGHSYFPVHDGNPDRVLGIVTVKALWANLSLVGKAEVRHLVTPALSVPISMSATKLLELFKRERRHMALVTDEFGSVRGLVTLNDVLESIVGDIPTDLKKTGAEAHRREDGSWLVDGLMEVGELKDMIGLRELPGESKGYYHTLAGFMLHRMGRIPKPAEKLEFDGWVFEVVDLDGQRVDKVLIREAE